MELKTWLSAEAGRVAKLAASLTEVGATLTPPKRIDTSFIWAWSQEPDDSRWRPIPDWVAPAIERFTKGEVMRWDCRPKDWFVVWPDLKKNPARPEFPELALSRALSDD